MRKLSALLAMTICIPALAAETVTELPDLVVTATRIPTPITDIAAGVTVIDRATLHERGYNSLTEALQAVPGLRLSAAGGQGGQASVFVRGTNSNHLLVLRDGMPINDAASANGGFDFGLDTLSDIERIEIVRGPMAALYGSGAIGGVINLISLRGTEPGPHVIVDLAGGYPEQVRGAISATGTDGRFDYALTAESQSQRGFDSTPQRMKTYTGTPDGYRDRIASANLGFTPVEGTRISLFLRGRSATFGLTPLGSAFDNASTSATAESVLGRIGVTSALFDGLLDTSLFLGGLHEDRHDKQPLNPLDPAMVSWDDRYHATRADTQWNNTLHLDRFIRGAALSATSLTFGFQRLVDSISTRTGYLSSDPVFGPFNSFGAARASMTSDAFHAGLQTTLWDRLTVTGQIRQDWIDTNAPFTWRLGGAVKVPELATHFKAAYGTSFRAASLYDRFGVETDTYGQYFGNPNLKPESAQGWELGFTTTLPAYGQPDFVSFGTTYFNQQTQNLILPISYATYNSVTNIGSAHVQGFESALALHPAAWLTLRLTHTYTDAQDADAGTRLLRRPQHSGSVGATIRPVERLTIAPEVTYTGAFRDYLTFNDGSFSSGPGTSQQGLIANLAVRYEVTEAVQLYATGRNLFGSRFEPVNGFQTPGTSVVVGVRMRLY